MEIREGFIPTTIGTAVTTTGYILKKQKNANDMLANTIFGFGLAHVVLGTIDLIQHRR
ncbi:asparagine synthase [Halomonas sp. MG34]|nr:asparagine synthase [Halomonas sp. MG34]